MTNENSAGPAPAFLYLPEAFDTEGRRLVGRRVAGQEFLRAAIRYGGSETVTCYARNRRDFGAFTKLVTPWLPKGKRLEYVAWHETAKLARGGVLFRPDPLLSQSAWQRSDGRSRAYSICGVTHTLADQSVAREAGETLLGPTRPWDALVCTSHAAQTVIKSMLEGWHDYLASKFGPVRVEEPQLPVIPLGVDCESFLVGDSYQAARGRIRASLEVGEGEVALLFVGRLVSYAKANPGPLYIGLQKIAEQRRYKFHLIMAGWFEEDRDEHAFARAARELCPAVRISFIKRPDAVMLREIWCAGDIFVSLSDNIQETFGLAPLEAMAAGLPVVVSDWSGYRDIVRHGRDGFLIPTLIPPAGAGLDFAHAYLTGGLNFSTYLGHASMATAVDLSELIESLDALIASNELRRRLGDSARARARETFDWPVIVRRYEELWRDLAARRQSPEPDGGQPGRHPFADDPFTLFTGFSTQTLPLTAKVQAGLMAPPEKLAILRGLWITNYGPEARLSNELVDELVGRVSRDGPQRIEDLIQRAVEVAPGGQAARSIAERTLVYLMKFGVLRLVPEAE